MRNVYRLYLGMEKEIKLWAFYYNPMHYESASYIVSYHRTKKGATEAMNAHKAKEKKEFDRIYDDKKGWKPKFGAYESWYVQKFTLKIDD